MEIDNRAVVVSSFFAFFPRLKKKRIRSNRRKVTQFSLDLQVIYFLPLRGEDITQDRLEYRFKHRLILVRIFLNLR